MNKQELMEAVIDSFMKDLKDGKVEAMQICWRRNEGTKNRTCLKAVTQPQDLVIMFAGIQDAFYRNMKQLGVSKEDVDDMIKYTITHAENVQGFQGQF